MYAKIILENNICEAPSAIYYIYVSYVYWIFLSYKFSLRLLLNQGYRR